MISGIGSSASVGPWCVVLVLYGVGLPFDMSMSAFLTAYRIAFGWDACMSPFGNFLSSVREVAQVPELLDVVRRLEDVCDFFLQCLRRAYDCEVIHAYREDDDVVLHASVEEAHVCL